MFNIRKMIIDSFLDRLKSEFRVAYGFWNEEYGNIAAWAGRMALENIANSDALYHDLEHTIMVTCVGQEILRGKHLLEGGVSPQEWLHGIVALLCHDIGYVYGICADDRNGRFATGNGTETRIYDKKGTDVFLTPYHVDRAKLFVRERFSPNLSIDEEKVASLIERTRFPIPDNREHEKASDFPGLIRASDLIGQLGDPNYLRKIPALYYEFEEIGTNHKIGYKNPEDMRQNYAKFYWETVSPYIQEGLRFLRVTQTGKQWIANLHSQVFEIEHGL